PRALQAQRIRAGGFKDAGRSCVANTAERFGVRGNAFLFSDVWGSPSGERRSGAAADGVLQGCSIVLCVDESSASARTSVLRQGEGCHRGERVRSACSLAE